MAHISDMSKGSIMDFMASATVEVTPGGAAKIEDFRDILHAGTVVYVTFLPGSDFAETIDTVVRLKAQEMYPVPHFAARSIPSADFLRDNLARLQDRAQVSEALLIGGGVSRPVGEFSSSLEVMQSGLFEAYGIRRLGIAGHPEGSPDISDADIMAALSAKTRYAETHGLALYIATQFCFEAAPIFAWEKRLREAGNRLPIHIGLPGLATVKTLLKHAQACGIGASMQFLRKRARQVAKLLTVSAPDKLLCDLVSGVAADEACLIRRVHLYPLGGLAKSVDWLYAVQEGRFEFDNSGGFRIV